MTETLLQLDIPTDVPQSVAAVLMMVLLLILTNRLQTPRAYEDQKARADTLEQANKILLEASGKKDETIRLQAETLADLREMGETVRRIMETVGAASDARNVRQFDRRRGGERA